LIYKKIKNLLDITYTTLLNYGDNNLKTRSKTKRTKFSTPHAVTIDLPWGGTLKVPNEQAADMLVSTLEVKMREKEFSQYQEVNTKL